MPCFKDPEKARARQIPPPKFEDLLPKFEAELRETLLKVAQMVRDEYSDQGIYGFILYHGQFGYIFPTLFTEHGLNKVSESEEDKVSTRWSPCDSPHHMIYEELFFSIQDYFGPAESDPEVNNDHVIEGVFLRCLRALREANIFPVDTLICLMEGDESSVQRYVYAECFNTPEALTKFRGEIYEFTNDELIECRERLRSFE